MIRPRAIAGRVMAMARPPRTMAESAALMEAAAQIGGGRSVQCVAGAIARRVVAELIAFVDETDPVPILLRKAQQQLAPSPFTALATDPEIDTAKDLLSRRKKAFEARGCRQWKDAEWSADNRRIADEVTRLLTGRYAKMLRSKKSS